MDPASSNPFQRFSRATPSVQAPMAAPKVPMTQQPSEAATGSLPAGSDSKRSRLLGVQAPGSRAAKSSRGSPSSSPGTARTRARAAADAAAASAQMQLDTQDEAAEVPDDSTGAGTPSMVVLASASASASALAPAPPTPGSTGEVVVGMREKLGEPPRPLRLIIIGHNPSETTWRRGHAYAHPSNHMWRLLIKTGIAPAGITGADDDDKMPDVAGVGFTDVGTGHPGTDSNAFHSRVFQGWSKAFYARMRTHLALASAAIGCTCGTCGAPALVAFSGKRQFMELLNIDKKGAAKVKGVEFGLQPTALTPPGWPFPAHTEIWVCCSTSGASPMTHAQREAPYRAVADRLAQVPFPYTPTLRCQPAAGQP